MSRGLGVLIALHLAGGCTRSPRPPDVLIVTLDAVRADHIAGFGGEVADAPNLAAWMERGRRYTNAYTTAPLTVPAHASLFSGLYPHSHGLRSQSPQQTLQLPLVTAANSFGYHTGAFVAAPILAPANSRLTGFTHVDAPEVERPASAVIDAATTWLQQVPPNEPALLWVHLFDAHFPYVPDDAPTWRDCPTTERQRALQQVRAVEKVTDLNTERPWHPCLRDLYRGELRELDAELPALQSALNRRGAPQWVIVADHGECLGEDGIWAQHGGTLAECALRIPLAIGGFAAATPASTDTRLASLVDIAPTVAAARGWPVAGSDGDNLLATAKPERAIRFEAAPIHIPGYDAALLGGRVGNEKVVVRASDAVHTWRLEAAGPVAIDPATLSPAGRALLEVLQHTPPPERLRPVAPATEQMLRGLGYVE